MEISHSRPLFWVRIPVDQQLLAWSFASSFFLPILNMVVSHSSGISFNRHAEMVVAWSLELFIVGEMPETGFTGRVALCSWIAKLVSQPKLFVGKNVQEAFYWYCTIEGIEEKCQICRGLNQKSIFGPISLSHNAKHFCKSFRTRFFRDCLLWKLALVYFNKSCLFSAWLKWHFICLSLPFITHLHSGPMLNGHDIIWIYCDCYIIVKLVETMRCC